MKKSDKSDKAKVAEIMEKVMCVVESATPSRAKGHRRARRDGSDRDLRRSLRVAEGAEQHGQDCARRTRDENFATKISSRVVSALATPLEKTGKGLLDFFRSCRPTATPQADGQVEFSFNIVPSEAETTLKDTFDFLESRKIEPVVAIDEFQQVREFPEQGVEAMLRSHVQFCTKSHFIFAGSKKHLMEEMFALPRGPFYQSTQLMNLDVIDRESFSSFAEGFFVRSARSFDRDAFAYLYDRFRGVTWYLQVVLNRIWERDEGLDGRDAVDEAIGQLVDEGESTYMDLLMSQTAASQAVLKAIAAEGTVREISAQALIDRYRLPTGSTIRSLVRELVEHNLIYKSADGYSIYDQLFGIWLKGS